MSVLEDNLRSGRPLLENAVLFRGTRLPDQTQGSYSTNTMHGSLLPQVAASYTHNWNEGTSFIGTYKVDREQTRFFTDYGLEQQLDGKKVNSVSVREAEQMLEPLVRNMANAQDSRERGRAEERLESFIKRNLYESNVPARTPDGAPNRPQDLYMYTGRPDVSIRRAVGMQMTKVTPQNEFKAKAVMFKEHRSATGKDLHRLASQPGPAQKAVATIKAIAQRNFGEKMQADHGHKPLNQMMDAVAKEPQSADQDRIGKFAKALVEGMGHPNAAVQAKASVIVNEISKLDPDKATYPDLVKTSAAASAKAAGQSMEEQKAASSKPAAPSPDRPAIQPVRSTSSMDR